MSSADKFKHLTDMIFAESVGFKADAGKIHKQRNEQIAYIKDTYKEKIADVTTT